MRSWPGNKDRNKSRKCFLKESAQEVNDTNALLTKMKMPNKVDSGDKEMVVEVRDETVLELVRSVASMEARLGAMAESMSAMQSEVAELKGLAAQAQGFTKATRMTWILLGLLLGAGGSEAVQAILMGLP